jgi:hypothetical protein
VNSSEVAKVLHFVCGKGDLRVCYGVEGVEDLLEKKVGLNVLMLCLIDVAFSLTFKTLIYLSNVDYSILSSDFLYVNSAPRTKRSILAVLRVTAPSLGNAACAARIEIVTGQGLTNFKLFVIVHDEEFWNSKKP